MKNPYKIPHRFREEMFRRYAPQLSQAFAHYPDIVAFEPVSVTPAVFAQGLRDAMTGKDRYGWTWPDLDEVKYKAHRHNMVITVNEGTVTLGPAQTVRRASKKAHLTVCATRNLKVVLPKDETVERTWRILELICRVIETGAIEAVRYEIQDMPWEFAERIEVEFPDVFIETVPNQPKLAILC